MRGAEAPVARTRVVTDAAVPGWVLRLAMALLVGLAGLAAGADGQTQWAITAAIALLLAARPYGMLIALGIAVSAAMYALDGPAGPWQLPVLLLATHLLLVLGAYADLTGWRARLEVAILRDALPSILTVQVAAQAAGVLAAVLQDAAPVPWLIVAALAGLGLLSWLVADQLARRSR